MLLIVSATIISSLPQSTWTDANVDYSDGCKLRLMYREEWFLRHVLNPTTLDGNALFYTRGGSKAAQNIARNCENRWMTIWNVCKSSPLFKP